RVEVSAVNRVEAHVERVRDDIRIVRIRLIGWAVVDANVLDVWIDARPPTVTYGGTGVQSDLIVGCGRKGLVIVLHVLHEAQPELLFVGKTACLASLLADLGEDREENGGENRYNSYNYE